MRNKQLKEMSKEELLEYVECAEKRLMAYSKELLSYARHVNELEQEVAFFKESSMTKCPSCRTFRNRTEDSCANCSFPLK